MVPTRARRALRPLSLLAAALAAACATSSAHPDAPVSTHVGTPIAFDAPIVGSDARFDVTAHRGDVVLVDFWASWCEPCRASMPFYDDLQARLGPRGLTVVGVGVDDDPALASRFAADVAVGFPLVWDEGHAVVSRYPIQRMPTAFLVDRAGVIRHVHAGFGDADPGAIEALVLGLLEAPH